MTDAVIDRALRIALCMQHIGLSEAEVDDLICDTALEFGALDLAIDWLTLWLELWCRRQLAVIDRATIDILDRELQRERTRAMDPSGRWA
jgi:hypothetical protein